MFKVTNIFTEDGTIAEDIEQAMDDLEAMAEDLREMGKDKGFGVVCHIAEGYIADHAGVHLADIIAI
jgi:coproporphyrinogen III oxidase